jgi:hypothetical protein
MSYRHGHFKSLTGVERDILLQESLAQCGLAKMCDHEKNGKLSAWQVTCEDINWRIFMVNAVLRIRLPTMKIPLLYYQEVLVKTFIAISRITTALTSFRNYFVNRVREKGAVKIFLVDTWKLREWN